MKLRNHLPHKTLLSTGHKKSLQNSITSLQTDNKVRELVGIIAGIGSLLKNDGSLFV